MTREQIESKLATLGGKKDAIREEMRALTAERDAIVAAETAAAKVAAMSSAERQALGLPEPQIVQGVGSIESKESVQG